MADLSTWRALAELMTAAGRPRDSLIRSRRTPVDVRFWRLRLRARVPGTMPACVSGAWRLVGDPSRPLGDRGEIAGLDQFVRLKMTAARSEGVATNRLIVSSVRPNRTRYFATTTTPVQGRRSDLALPVSIAAAVSGFNPGRRDRPFA